MSSRAEPLTTLASLANGDRALVLEIGEHDPKLGAKLAARGVVPGVEISVIRGGDPLLLTVDDSKWALNRADASTVTVDIIQPKRGGLFARLWSR